MRLIYTSFFILFTSIQVLGASVTISWKLYSDPAELQGIILEQSCDNRVTWSEIHGMANLIPVSDTSTTVTGLTVGDFCDWRMFAVFLNGSKAAPSNTVGRSIMAGPIEQVTVDP